MQAVQAQGGAAVTVAPVMSYEDFILTGDLCCVEALKISVGQIAAPALEYYEHTVEGEMGGQIKRMRLARAVFDPLHVKANGLSPGLIEDLFDGRDCIGPIALDRTRLFENLCHGHPLAGLLAAR